MVLVLQLRSNNITNVFAMTTMDKHTNPITSHALCHWIMNNLPVLSKVVTSVGVVIIGLIVGWLVTEYWLNYTMERMSVQLIGIFVAWVVIGTSVAKMMDHCNWYICWIYRWIESWCICKWYITWYKSWIQINNTLIVSKYQSQPVWFNFGQY